MPPRSRSLAPGHAQPSPRCLQGAPGTRQPDAIRPLPGDHHQIHRRQLRNDRPKRLAHPALDAVPADCVRNLRGHCDPDPRRAALSLQSQHHEIASDQPLAALLDRKKLVAAPHARRLPESHRSPRSLRHLLLRRGRRQPLAALGATALQHFFSTRRLRTTAEAVRPVPLDLLRLISPFHGAATSPIGSCLSRFPSMPRVLARPLDGDPNGRARKTTPFQTEQTMALISFPNQR